MCSGTTDEQREVGVPRSGYWTPRCSVRSTAGASGAASRSAFASPAQRSDRRQGCGWSSYESGGIMKASVPLRVRGARRASVARLDLSGGVKRRCHVSRHATIVRAVTTSGATDPFLCRPRPTLSALVTSPKIVESSDDAIVSKDLNGIVRPGTAPPSGCSATPPRKPSAGRSGCIIPPTGRAKKTRCSPASARGEASTTSRRSASARTARWCRSR